MAFAIGIVGRSSHEREMREADRIGIAYPREKTECLLVAGAGGAVVGADQRDVAEAPDAVGQSEEGADALEEIPRFLIAGRGGVMVERSSTTLPRLRCVGLPEELPDALVEVLASS